MMLLRSVALPAPGCRGSSQLSSSTSKVARPRVPAARDASRIIRGASGAREELKTVVQAATPAPTTEDEPSLFFEPLVRGFFLGVGAGVLTEFAHVALKVSDFVAAAESLESLPGLLPQVFPELAPLVALDNVAALSSWCFFYLIEVAAIIAILRDHPNDDSVAKKAISSSVTLPKALMPISLSSVKLHMYRLLHSGRFGSAGVATAAPALSAGSGAASDADSFGSAEPLAFLDDGPSTGMPPMPAPGARAGLGRGGAGTAVLERPSAFPPLPAPQQHPDEEEEEQEVTQQQQGTGAPAGQDSTATASPPTPPAVAPAKPAPRPEAAATARPAKKHRKPSYGVPAEKRAGLRPGEWDPTLRASEVKRAKELSDRRSYLNNFWYAAALSQDVLPGKVKEVQMLGRTVALFRDAETGAVRALDNVCPHRGAPLGKGWAKQVKGHGTCVVCPYHGWAFDKEGRLAEVPSSPAGAAFPKRPLVDAYPLQEQGGFVWLFFGAPSLPADERPPIPMIPELSDPKWRAVYGEIEFDCPHWGVFENAIDMAHIHYLHGDSFGNSEKPVIEGMAVDRSTFSVTSSFNIHNKPVSPLWDWTAVDSVPVTATAFLPSTSAVKIQLGAGVSMITFVNTVPIDANRSVNRFCLVRNFAGWDGFDTWARNAMYRILGEDKVMVEKLTPEALRREVSLDADKPQIAFRKLRQEWIDIGYGVDPAATSGHHGSLSVDM